MTFLGDDGRTEFGWRSSKSSTNAKSAAEEKLSDEVQSSCRIYFPTKETVARSRGGVGVSELPISRCVGILPLSTPSDSNEI
jgi:hypothetical protein